MNRIRELRKQNKMTQKELAKHLQIADSTLSYWEMGKYEPDNESLRKLAKFFLVPIDYILCGEYFGWEQNISKAAFEDIINPIPEEAVPSVSGADVPYGPGLSDSDYINPAERGIGSNGSGALSVLDINRSANEHIPMHSNGAPYTPPDPQTALRRSEFMGLSGDEIDKLAEYAEFLKMQRAKKRAGNRV